MSFDKNYPNRKDHRSNYEYEPAKRNDRRMRNHGGDTYTEESRLIKTKKSNLIAKQELASLNLEKEPYMEGIGGA